MGFFVLFFASMLHRMRDLSSLVKDRTSIPHVESRVFTTVLPGKSLTNFILELSFIYLFLFLAALGLCFCARTFSSYVWGYSLVTVCGLLLVVVSLVTERRL